MSVLLLITHVNLQLAQNKKFNLKIYNQSQRLVSDFCEMRAILWPLFMYFVMLLGGFFLIYSYELLLYRNYHV